MIARTLLIFVLGLGMALPGPALAQAYKDTILYRVIDRGRTDWASVRIIQRELRRLGYEPGPVDGLFGARTQEAIAAWQRDTGQIVSGLGRADGGVGTAPSETPSVAGAVSATTASNASNAAFGMCLRAPQIMRGRKVLGGLACY